MALAPLVVGGESRPSEGPRYYSTAPAPASYVGPSPVLMAFNDATTNKPELEAAIPAPVPLTVPAPVERPAASAAPVESPQPARVASVASNTQPLKPKAVTPAPAPAPSAADALKIDAIARAKKAIADCKARFTQVHDYTCTFLKRERIDGRLSTQHIMAMKARSQPASIYFKFQQPNKGREAIYFAGRFNNRVLAHDVGIGKLVAGTLHLDPNGARAMEDCRHPVTHAGISALIDTVSRHWSTELTPEESEIIFHPNILVGGRACTMIESIHPQRRADFLFYKVKLYIDREHGLPIRFEAFDWPKHPGAPGELAEEYTYHNLRVNVGLRDIDFDPANPQYTFGRF